MSVVRREDKNNKLTDSTESLSFAQTEVVYWEEKASLVALIDERGK